MSASDSPTEPGYNYYKAADETLCFSAELVAHGVESESHRAFSSPKTKWPSEVEIHGICDLACCASYLIVHQPLKAQVAQPRALRVSPSVLQSGFLHAQLREPNPSPALSRLVSDLRDSTKNGQICMFQKCEHLRSPA